MKRAQTGWNGHERDCMNASNASWRACTASARTTLTKHRWTRTISLALWTRRRESERHFLGTAARDASDSILSGSPKEKWLVAHGAFTVNTVSVFIRVVPVSIRATLYRPAMTISKFAKNFFDEHSYIAPMFCCPVSAGSLSRLCPFTKSLWHPERLFCYRLGCFKCHSVCV